MFAKKNRLAKDTDIKRVLAAGRSFFSPHLSVKYLRVPEVVVPRVTFVVSSKVSKLAVNRNRLKRILRAELSMYLTSLKNGDYLFRVKPGVLKVEERELRAELLTLLKRARLLN